jgi:hypothetical protein
VTRRSPGVRIEPRAYPESGSDIAHNYSCMLPIVKAATGLVTLKASAKLSFEAYTGLVSHKELVTALGDLRWMTPAYFQPDFHFLEEASNGRIDDWFVIVPLTRDHDSTAKILTGLGRRSIFERGRQEGKSFGAISEPRHREPAKFIAGVELVDLGDQVIKSYASPARGAILIYPVVTKEHPKVKADVLDRSDVYMCFELWAPLSSCPSGSRLVQFRVRNRTLEDSAIVPLT